jgi:hypothetical protein
VSAHPEASRTAERLRAPRGIALLWAAVLAGPLAWLLALNLQYALVRVACTGGTTLPLHLVTVVALAVAAGGLLVGWAEWRRMGETPDPEAGGVGPRSRFMCVVGMMTGAIFALAIVAQWLGTLFLNPCMAL